MVCKHLGRIRSENAGGEGWESEGGEEGGEAANARDEVVPKNDNGEGQLKVLDKDPDPDLCWTFFNKTSEIPELSVKYLLGLVQIYLPHQL